MYSNSSASSCNGTVQTMTSLEGTVTNIDATSSNYAAGISCGWIIDLTPQPEYSAYIDYIEISFTTFDLKSGASLEFYIWNSTTDSTTQLQFDSLHSPPNITIARGDFIEIY